VRGSQFGAQGGWALTVEGTPWRRLGGGWGPVGRAFSGGSGYRQLGHGAGRSFGNTCRHGGGAGRLPVWLDDGKVFTTDEEDGGELALRRPLWWLGLGSEP
jgi:hypothetical protein